MTAEPDVVEGFFDELSRRGHDPLLGRLEATGRFELRRGEQVDCWVVAVRGGWVTVERADGDVDWVMRTDRATFAELVRGDSGVLAAYLGGDLDIEFAVPSMRLGLIRRLFAGPPGQQRIREGSRAGRVPR